MAAQPSHDEESLSSTEASFLQLPHGERISLSERCTLGRHPDCTITLDGNRISRWHAAVLRLSPGDYRLMDLGTMNGTSLNGRRVVEPMPLRDGDLITIGDHEIRFGSPASPHSERGRNLESTHGITRAHLGKSDTMFEACGHGIVVLESDQTLAAMTESVRQWVTRYFPEFDASTPSLPPEIMEWLRQQQSAAADSTAAATLERQRGERRLIISLKRDLVKMQTLLLFTEEEPLFTLNSLVNESKRAFSFTRREGEVAFYLSAGKSNFAIGTILGNSDRTIQKHVISILAKLGVEDRQSAIVRIFEHFKSLPRATD